LIPLIDLEACSAETARILSHKPAGEGVQIALLAEQDLKRRSCYSWTLEKVAQEMGFCDMNEEVVGQADDLTYEISDEALETAADNVSFPAWTRACTGCPCQRRGFEKIVNSGPHIMKPFGSPLRP
jgi:hypothetical protein